MGGEGTCVMYPYKTLVPAVERDGDGRGGKVCRGGGSEGGGGGRSLHW